MPPLIVGLQGGLGSGLNVGLGTSVHSGNSGPMRSAINACAVVSASLLVDRPLSADISAVAVLSSPELCIKHALTADINAAATVSAEFSAASGATSIDDIFGAADPKQMLIDTMGYTGPKPDYMWLANAASGAIVEVDGAGPDLTAVSTPVYQQTSVALGGTSNCMKFDSAADGVRNTSGDLDFDLDDFTILHIFESNMHGAGEYIISDRSGDGWGVFQSGTDGISVYVDPNGGFETLTVNGHSLNEAQVLMFRREVGAVNGIGLYTKEGSDVADDPGGDIVSNSPNFAIGDGALGAGATTTWAICAAWRRADITNTHRQTFAEALSYE